MKKKFLNLSLYLFACFFLYNCHNSFDEEIDALKIEEVINLKKSSQKLAYSLLTENEKHILWNQKLNFILKNEKAALNNDQTAFVKELINELNPSFFKKDLKENNIENYYKLLKQEEKAKTLFSDESLRNYFSNINLTNANDITAKNIIIKDITNKAIVDEGEYYCDCSRESDWCPWGSNCFVWFCKKPTIGCGWLLSYTCNGICAH
ncbi:hypothetical protein KCTC32516_01388 [Polaribacter huanghezhanensis]|uniref:bacteriocin fulvocin C-related protein n=1 Tax=Polaribacter huanghezhanensis TaxID=1354726 RepID=UPI002649121D|nr:bacteriocin fulvocin C-related protein [Polaribacter huanghezhanensis]WKD86037.1 hypothetical protein KCTC32516_01388 [Polaribacter huanghezhanensis]